MISIYCRNKHTSPTDGLCSECLAVEKYAHLRLEKCLFGDEKPTCEKCPVHCYKTDLRIQMQAIMRYSGPRMIFYHPLTALKHLLRNRKKVNLQKR